MLITGTEIKVLYLLGKEINPTKKRELDINRNYEGQQKKKDKIPNQNWRCQKRQVIASISVNVLT